MKAADVISMPDAWEYPWFAAWDLAFHCGALALVDGFRAANASAMNEIVTTRRLLQCYDIVFAIYLTESDNPYEAAECQKQALQQNTVQTLK